jgi:hypothetical protein
VLDHEKPIEHTDDGQDDLRLVSEGTQDHCEDKQAVRPPAAAAIERQIEIAQITDETEEEEDQSDCLEDAHRPLDDALILPTVSDEQHGGEHADGELRRRGSEATLPRLRAQGVEFAHCDIRNPEDLRLDGYTEDRPIDLLLECSAEPSVLAGYGEVPDYVINTNLVGTINCLELARRHHADVIFLSTSRVYPIKTLNQIATVEGETRFELAPAQQLPGVSARGIAEDFPLEGARSLYGATKLCSELLMQEYGAMYGLRCIINRCGVLTGPWQMGKVD